MKILNIRVVELICSEKLSATHSFQIFVHTSFDWDKMMKIKINSTEKEQSTVMKGDKPIQFEVPSQKDEFIHVYLKRHRLLLKDDMLGKLTLPMSWFPTNHIVREWFPLKASPGVQDGGMVLLDIHFDGRNVNPFMAPFAALRVYPNWTRPTLTENAEFPTIPPIVYIIPPSVPNQNLPPHQQYQYPPQGNIYAPQYYPMPINPTSPTPYNLSNPPPPSEDSKLNNSDSESDKKLDDDQTESSYANSYYQQPNDDSVPQFAMPSYPSAEENDYNNDYNGPTVF